MNATPDAPADRGPARRRRRFPRVLRDRSVGIVLYRETPQGRVYLILLKHRSTDFPKGHVEPGETDVQAARRELAEEAGITDVTLHDGYLGATTYTLRRGAQITRKTVSFFLGQTAQEAVTISREHKGFVWLPVAQALRKISFESQRALVRKAEEMLTQR